MRRDEFSWKPQEESDDIKPDKKEIKKIRNLINTRKRELQSRYHPRHRIDIDMIVGVIMAIVILVIGVFVMRSAFDLSLIHI